MLSSWYLALTFDGPSCYDLNMQVNFAPDFVAAPGKADVKAVADHVEHIATISGKQQ